MRRPGRLGTVGTDGLPRMGRGRRPGLPVPPHTASSADVCVVYPWQVHPGLGGSGTFLAFDLLGGMTRWHFDPFDLYDRKMISGPNVMVAGKLGEKKSLLVKLFLDRTVGVLASPDGSPRWCAVFDPKGEYGPLADRLGLAYLRLAPGNPAGTVVLNPLDVGDDDPVSARNARRSMMVALLASALRRDLTALEESAVGWAVVEAGRRRGRPTLRDVDALLADPTDAMREDAGHRSWSEMARALEDVHLALRGLLDGRLAGMFDGPSTVELEPGGRGLVIDLSAVWEDRDACRLAMLAASGWLSRLIVANRGRYGYVVVDEAWLPFGDEHMARAMQGWGKFSRQFGISVWWLVHNLSALGSQAADGTATEKITESLLEDAETRFVFAQEPGELKGRAGRAGAAARLGLTDKEAQRVATLVPGQAVVKIGARYSALIQLHVDPGVPANPAAGVAGVPGDWSFCDTDQAMRR